MPYTYFTEDQKRQANEVDLASFLRAHGERLIPSGRDLRLERDHSVTIRGQPLVRPRHRERRWRCLLRPELLRPELRRRHPPAAGWDGRTPLARCPGASPGTIEAVPTAACQPGYAPGFRLPDQDPRHNREVLTLARQELLSTAELIKCAEVCARDISTGEKLMEVLYDDDDTTSDNMPEVMRTAKSREEITMAVADLYLRKQIILQRI